MAAKSPIPAREGLLLEADNGLTVSDYNMKTGIRTKVAADVTEGGALVLSARLFGDMIRRQTGQTASEYIQRKIIGRAKEYLLSSDMTMSQIAYELGFQYPQHRSRMFKRVAGCTPNEFRNRQ